MSRPPAKKRTRAARLPAAARRQAILDAAKDIFLKEGYARTTMRRIATQLGITPTTLYLHFADKETLMHAICQDAMRVLAEGFARVGREAKNPSDAFERFFDVYMQFGFAHPREYRLLFMSEAPAFVPGHRNRPDTARDPADQGQQAFGALEVLVKRLMDEGIFRKGDPAATAEAIWASVHGLVSLLITYPDFAWSERSKLFDAMRGMMRNGFMAK
jgi:AcrR family transcriptional regulator